MLLLAITLATETHPAAAQNGVVTRAVRGAESPVAGGANPRVHTPRVAGDPVEVIARGESSRARVVPPGSASLEALVAAATSSHPKVKAAQERVAAARARIAPAGQLPDPMIGLGVMNLPLRDPSLRDEMSMVSLAASQMLPFPGKLAQQRRVMESELAVAEAMAAGVRLDVEMEVRSAYYELAYADGALAILAQNQEVLGALIEASAARYASSLARQQDVLNARNQAAGLAQEAVTVAEERRAASARLNAALGRETDHTISPAALPSWIMALARFEGVSARQVPAALGARAAGSPLPPLPSLQDQAVALNPELRAQAAAIAAQAARVAWSGKQHLPDVELSAQYGMRSGNADVVSVMASVPLPLRRGNKQAAELTAARADLAALEAEHRDRVNGTRARVAELYAELERARTHAVLFTSTVVPQGRATVNAIMASLEIGDADLPALLEQHITVYGYELAQLRALTDIALKLAALERTVGSEVLR